MDDLISRQAAIAEVHNEFDECLVWDESGKCTADEVERILEDLPSAQPERKKGKWLRKLSQTPWPICSECGIYGANESNYCPNCGAKMEVEHE